METSLPTTFGDLLQTLRKQRHVNQQTLADKLGIHINTISKWERGICLPNSKGMVLELAHQLRLNERETRQILEASLTALSPYWLVPHPRNPFFTGRTDLLSALHQRLHDHHQAVAISQAYAVSGLGGIGKTQLALEYAYQHAADYDGVFWLGAETVETLYASFTSIAELLGLPEQVAKEHPQVAQAVLRWLASHKGWLVIYDNVEDVLTLKPFLPAARQGAVLLTTRLRALEGLAPSLNLPPFDMEEGVRFLLARTGLLVETALVPEALLSSAQALVAALDGLPLALDQAGSYIERHGSGLPDYLHLYQQRQLALLADRSPAAEHPQSVVTTFSLSFEQVAQASPAAAEVLRACAFLAPEAIPEELLTQGAAQWGPDVDEVVADPDRFNRALGEALRYSLLQRDAQRHTLTQHRLVQAVLRAHLEAGSQRAWAEQVIRLVAATFPDPQDYTTWPDCQRLLPHALVCADHIAHWGFSFPEGARLLNHVGEYLRRRAQHSAALPHLQQALHIREQVLSADHPEVAASLHSLAILYREQGKYAEAAPLHQRALRIREEALGPDHPEVAASLNGLAKLAYDQGHYAQAEPFYQRALRIRERALGPDHPLVADTLNSLATLYREQGKYARAEPLYQRALHIREQALRPDHPDVAYPLTNLAVLYRQQGKHAHAEPLFQRALRIREHALGSDHPLVADTLYSLATLYREQGRYTEAEPLLQRVLHIWEQAQTPDHPRVAYPLLGLAIIAREQGRYAAAEPLFQRALHIREQALGPDHPLVAESLNALAVLCHAQGQDQDALRLAQRARTIREQTLGPDHPVVATSLDLEANLRRSLGQPDQADALNTRAQAIRAKRTSAE